MSLIHAITADFTDMLHQKLHDANYAASYLQTAMEDGDEQEFALAVRDVAEAYGVTPPETNGALSIDAFIAVAKAAGLRVFVAPYAA
jgi:DNA-binding phage protein